MKYCPICHVVYMDDAWGCKFCDDGYGLGVQLKTVRGKKKE